MPPRHATLPTSPVTAVLGPTNTGKTHLAVERMLAHAGGMIGLPLRLLAREIYDRVRLRAGDHAVALITGEEKIIPAQPRYWVCTVEAMPPDLRVPFLAIDEVQLAGDLERGHIFTDRILHRRGLEETMLLGSGTMRPILQKLLPGTTFISRPRFSKLTYEGPRKLSRLPRRSAIVAFTAEMVYTVAEMIRRQRGGAAVVMGALSPRTRNAQVALYQAGDVDYLVATDAIGMGVNMDVDHVAFAQTRKFDGFQYRNLNPGELGQVAGRAGRYMNDGSFGVTGEAEGFEPEIIDRLENHNFESLRVMQWRNRDLDFRSLDGLRKSLGHLPEREGLTRAQPTADIETLEAVLRDASLSSMISSPFEVERAWDVCQVPDYRNISPAEHAHLISRVLAFLHSKQGVIDEDWFAKQLAFCENLEGNIDSLSQRIFHVRTWTFIANRADWLEAPLYWQGRAREIEDRLSDALHEKLTQRFIDRRTSVLMRRLAKKEGLMSSIEEDGAISVEGEVIGRIAGLSFVPGEALAGGETKLLKQAAVQALTTEVTARAISLTTTADTELRLSRQGDLIWQGQVIGKLQAGDARFKTRIEVIADDLLAPSLREDVRQRLQKFVDRSISAVLEPLLKLEEAEGLEGATRGIAYRLAENFGVLPRDDVAQDVKALAQEDRARLRNLGVRFGAHTLFLPALLKPAATELRMLLWWLDNVKSGTVSGAVPSLPPNGLTSMTADHAMPEGFYRMGGYRISGKRAVRVDMLERLADMIRDRLFWKPRIPEEQRPVGSFEGGGFTVVPDMMSIVGCSGEDFQEILTSLGYRSQIRQVAKPVQSPHVAGEKVESAPQVLADVVEAVAAVAIESSAPETAVDVSDVALPTLEVPVVEKIDVTVWWPKDMGPFKVRPPRIEKPKFDKPRFDKQNFDGQKTEGKPHKKRFDKSDRKPDRSPPERPKRPEKPMDPNSPFAILGALKASMGKGNS
jgi:ATP-dependent RNA helicase SUPV3L1/SUV3